MKKIFTALTFILWIGTLYQQGKNYEFHFKTIPPVETDEYKITFVEPHTQKDFAKVHIQVQNKTNDYLVIDLSEIKFVFEFGEITHKPNFEALSSKKEKKLVIKPNKSKTKELTATGDYDFSKVESFNVEINEIYLLSTEGQHIEGENMRIPPVKNTIKVGGVLCNVKKYEKGSKETYVKFKIVNEEDEIIFFDPSKVSVEFPTGNIYGNDEKRSKIEVLNPNETIGFVFLCTKKKGEPTMKKSMLELIWNDAFIRPNKILIQKISINFDRDSSETINKN